MSKDSARFEIPGCGLWGFAHCAFFDSWYPWSKGDYQSRLGRLLADLKGCRANSFRPHIHWRRVEQVLASRVDGPESVTDDSVESYSRGGGGVDWSLYDSMIDGLLDAGVVPHIVVSAGYDFQLPVLETGTGYRVLEPDLAGCDRYIGHAYLHARAAVRRYSDRVRLWQLENELNAAGETMLFMGWRSGRAWLDPGFRRALIAALSEAVRAEDPGSLTTHNFHTQLRVVKGLYDWRADVREWSNYLDVVGVDCYPNYVFGWPSRGAAVGRKVGQALEVSDGRPVMVLESGYSVRPRWRGNNEARQAEFARDAVESTVKAGGSGFYYYKLVSPEGYPVEGPWSNRFFQNIEPWWGFVRPDDSKRPAWFAYRRSIEAALKERLRGGAT